MTAPARAAGPKRPGTTAPATRFSATRRSGAVGLVLVLYLAGFSSWFWWSDGQGPLRTAVCDAAYLPLNAAGVALALRTWRSPRLPLVCRRMWPWLVAAYVSRAWGDGAWFLLEGVLREEPFPSVADLGYVGFYPLVFVALLRVPTQVNVGRERLRLLCELLAVVGAGWMLLWLTVIRPTVGSAQFDLTFVLSIGYPLADLALIAVVASVALRRPSPAARLVFTPLALSMGFFALADSTFAATALSGTWEGGELSDVFWLAALALAAYAPVRQWDVLAQPTVELEEPAGGTAGVGTAGYTYAAVLLGGGLLWSAVGLQPFSRLGGLMLGLTVLLLGVLARQVLAVEDADRNGHALGEALRRNVELRAGLEQTVAARTSELAARTRELKEQAYRDSLTGLGNRLALRELLDDTARGQTAGALLMVDLDGFQGGQRLPGALRRRRPPRAGRAAPRARVRRRHRRPSGR